MLRICELILEVLRLLKPIIDRIRQHDPNLADQLQRAGASILLNASEGSYSHGRNVGARFKNAVSSAGEARSCLPLAVAWGYIEPIDPALADNIDKVVATLYKLSKR